MTLYLPPKYYFIFFAYWLYLFPEINNNQYDKKNIVYSLIWIFKMIYKNLVCGLYPGMWRCAVLSCPWLWWIPTKMQETRKFFLIYFMGIFPLFFLNKFIDIFISCWNQLVIFQTFLNWISLSNEFFSEVKLTFHAHINCELVLLCAAFELC